MARVVANYSQNNPGFPFQGRVLLVDENKAVREVGQRLLERLGLPVVTARSGMEALDLLRSLRQDIGLVLISGELAPVEGIPVTAYILGAWPDLPVALVLSVADHETKAYYLSIGVCGIIEKPFGIDELKAFIGQIRCHVAFFCDAETVRS